MRKTPIHKNKSLKSLKGEQWREIPYTEGYYVVSNLGRVKSLERIVYSRTVPNGRKIKEKILSQWVAKQKNRHTGDHTYQPVVSLFLEGKPFRPMVSRPMVRRLVYEAFVLPYTKQKMDGMFVYPLDGNGLNNKADNLGLAARSELRLRELQYNRYLPPVDLLPKEFYTKSAIALNRRKRKKVKKYTPKGRLVASYSSIIDAAKKTKSLSVV